MSIGSKTSQLFCITFFGLCGFPPVAPYSVPFPSSKPATSRPAVSGQTPIQVVHFSDIHVDPFYETGASYNCTKPICCRPYTTADSPGNNNYPAGPYGNTNCDAPVSLEESMYAAIQSIAPNAAFTLFTGDIVDHAVWLDNETQNIKDINDAYSRMSGLVNVYGTAGNHEAAPANAFPPTALKTTAEQWVYDTLSADWTPWIGATSAAAADQFGAYSVLNGNLKIISINTNLYYKENYYLYEPTMETDPSGQLAWLVSELQDAETNGYRAYIIGHMPMGVGDAFHDGSNYFDQIVNRYSATIAALFFGHTHVDQFEIAYSDYTAQSYSNALEVSYIAPSMTPTSGSPAFRVYTVDPVTFGVLDITTYIANITSPDYQTTGPVWEEYYSAKSVYGPLVGVTDPTAELTPAFWHNVTVAFENDDAAFQDYETRKSRGYTPGDCTGTCKTSEICAMRAAQAQYNCATITPGISFKRDLEGVGKRDFGAVPEVGECEGSLLRPILAKLAAKDGLLEEAVVNARVKYLKEKH
jgi:sphingomyelin phosphodiesterase